MSTEAEDLLGCEIKKEAEMEDAAKDLVTMGAQAVIVKGGHQDGPKSLDCLYVKGNTQCSWYAADRIKTNNNHGTGCTLSAAIGAYLAQGYTIEEAVGQGKVYLTGALKAGSEYFVGHGHGPVHHFFNLWKEKEVLC